MRMNTREWSLPRARSFSARVQKNRGGRKSDASQTLPVSSHSSHCGMTLPFE